MSKKQLGWYFSRDDKRLGYDDGRTIEPGITHTVDCTPIVCQQGLHASKRIMDALKYTPGPYIWRVELSGTIVEDTKDYDKMAATERTYLWGFDATELLRDFARRCALDVIHLWNAPDVVVEYLLTGNEELQTAAYAAARDAANAAARDAARDAANAANAAANAALRDKQNRRLTSMVIAARKRLEAE